MEESQGETATAHFPEQMWEYHPSYGKDKSLYAMMAELLWNSGHEEQHRKHERMAVPPNKDVYLEAVETAKDPEKKTNGSGNARVGCL